MLKFGLKVMRFESLDFKNLEELIRRFTKIDEPIDKKY